MKKLRAVLAASAVVAVSVSALGGVAVANQPYPLLTDGGPAPQGISQWIRMGGATADYTLMVDLASLYTKVPGCVQQVPPGGTQQYDGSCADQDAVTPGVQLVYEADGAGNQTDDGNPEKDVPFNYGNIGANAGLTQITNEPAPGYEYLEVARVSRARKNSDNANLRFFEFALDALPWSRWGNTSGNPSFGVNSLTVSQLAAIFSGCGANASNPQIDLAGNGGNANGVADWGDVGGVTGQPIIVWTTPTTGATRTAFDGFLGSTANSANCIPSQYKDGNLANGERVIPVHDSDEIVTHTNSPLNLDCQELPATSSCELNSIWSYDSGVWANKNPGSTVGQPGSFDGAILGSITVAGVPVAPTTANIQSNAYPFVRGMYNVIRFSFPSENASNAARAFVGVQGFLCKDDGSHGSPNKQLIDPDTHLNYRTEIQNIITQDGFVPIPWGDSQGPATGTNSYCRVS